VWNLYGLSLQMVGRVAEALIVGIADGDVPEGGAMPAVRSLAAEAGCSPGTVVHAYERLESLGLVARRDRSRARVVDGARVRARMLLGAPRPVRLSGSDDPALDVVLRAVGEQVAADAGPRGSVTGLNRLARGEADVALLHLLDVASGTYNDPFVRRLLGDEPVALVHLCRREQGLVLPRGNPRAISSVGDLDGLRLAWRSPGTATRLLLERLLSEARIEVDPARGSVVDSHRAVASAVATGAVDAGLAVRAAAVALDLDFLPLVVEPFELAVAERDVDLTAPLLDPLTKAPLASQITELGGYDLTDTGSTRRAA
jgi:putative molybdopterin biosynthesis protein